MHVKLIELNLKSLKLGSIDFLKVI